MNPIASPSLRFGSIPMRLVGSGVAFPDRIVTTDELLDRLAGDIPPARRRSLALFFDEDIGVRTRAHLVEGCARDLALVAARRALEEAGVVPSALVYATSTPSRWTSPESAWLARSLGLSCAFFDVRSGCTGGLYAIVEGARLARDSGAPVLVVGADAFSTTFGDERLLPVSMGDGAGAIVLVPSDDPAIGIRRAVFGGAPDRVELATVMATLPPTTLDRAAWSLAGDPAVFGEATETALGLALDALDPDDAARIVVHTGRASIARKVAATRSKEPFLDVLRDHGNLGAATLLVALDRLRKAGAPRLALVSAGGGLSFGAAEIVGHA